MKTRHTRTCERVNAYFGSRDLAIYSLFLRDDGQEAIETIAKRHLCKLAAYITCLCGAVAI